MAALLLVAIGLASFVYFVRFAPMPSGPAVAQLQPAAAPTERSRERRSQLEAAAVEMTPKTARHDVAGERRSAAPSSEAPKQSPKKAVPGASAPAKAEESILTDRLEMFRIDRVEVSLPSTFRLQALTQDNVRQQLLAELRKSSGFRVELPCRGGALAWKLLEPELSALGLGLAIDQAAEQRLRTPKLRTNFVVYIEDIQPEELARLLESVGRQDRTAARKTQQLQFTQVVLTRLSAQDHKELATLLGTDPTRSESPLSLAKPDPRQPLSDLTARQVADSLAGQGSNPRPTKTAAVTKPGQRLAMVLAYNPVRPHPNSPEVQRFLRARKPLRPGSLRILLVLRG